MSGAAQRRLAAKRLDPKSEPTREPAKHLLGPDVAHRGGTHDQNRPFAQVGAGCCNGLDGLAQPHLITWHRFTQSGTQRAGRCRAGCRRGRSMQARGPADRSKRALVVRARTRRPRAGKASNARGHAQAPTQTSRPRYARPRPSRWPWVPGERQAAGQRLCRCGRHRVQERPGHGAGAPREPRP